ncbi:hypothetical protein CKO28_00765 [Rhodovibrio sodomensis]|uniref:DNA gyrase B subunit C-terminal domain-containing protein n=1 Tax=Rhodovibrio sodomensis TaxID=1088 RepID=A0ABS1DAE6_9PROT|nr:hypothetical protein [Rhodovibrio sodomensis]
MQSGRTARAPTATGRRPRRRPLRRARPPARRPRGHALSGLGETDPNHLCETTLDADNRVVRKVMAPDLEESAELVSICMGALV